MSNSSRRDFLKASGMCIMAGGTGIVGTEAFLRGAPVATGNDVAAEIDPERQKPTLVTIFLRGGADALNAIIPVGDSKYYSVRPGIAIPHKAKPGEDAAACAIPYPKQKEMWGLHPSLAKIVPLVEANQLIAITNVGSPHGTRSHFSAQDYMERASLGNAAYSQGWLNRYLELSKKPYDAPLRGLSAMSLLPRSLRGSYPVLAGNNRAQDMGLFANLYAPENMVNMTARDEGKMESGSSLNDRPMQKKEVVKQGLNSDQARDIITESGANAVLRLKALEKAAMTPIDATYPGGGLGAQLSTIARVIKANVGLEVAQADYGGWDHHSGMGGIKGAHANMLSHLAACLAAFHEDLGARNKKVVVLVMSEFGRTVHENGSNGTDHGRAGFMLAMGDMLNGGKVYGEWKGMDELDQARFQPVHSDFRTVFAETLVKLFRFDPYKSKMFPSYNGSPSDFLNFMNQMPEA